MGPGKGHNPPNVTLLKEDNCMQSDSTDCRWSFSLGYDIWSEVPHLKEDLTLVAISKHTFDSISQWMGILQVSWF